MKNPEAHHSLPVEEGGTNADLVLCCRTCHAGETEKQELKGAAAPMLYESQLSPEMMETFMATPRPRQLC